MAKQMPGMLGVIPIEWAKADKFLIDTSVWIDLAKDQSKPSLLHALEELVRYRQVALVLPQIVIDEFARNRARVLKENAQSLISALNRVRETVLKFGDARARRTVNRELIEVERKVVNAGDQADASIARIEALFAGAEIRPTSDAIKLRASQRAIEKKAPFRGERNSFNDAVLIETYADLVSESHHINAMLL